jgi:hypothetical protein
MMARSIYLSMVLCPLINVAWAANPSRSSDNKAKKTSSTSSPRGSPIVGAITDWSMVSTMHTLFSETFGIASPSEDPSTAPPWSAVMSLFQRGETGKNEGEHRARIGSFGAALGFLANGIIDALEGKEQLEKGEWPALRAILAPYQENVHLWALLEETSATSASYEKGSLRIRAYLQHSDSHWLDVFGPPKASDFQDQLPPKKYTPVLHFNELSPAMIVLTRLVLFKARSRPALWTTFLANQRLRRAFNEVRPRKDEEDMRETDRKWHQLRRLGRQPLAKCIGGLAQVGHNADAQALLQHMDDLPREPQRFGSLLTHIFASDNGIGGGNGVHLQTARLGPGVASWPAAERWQHVLHLCRRQLSTNTDIEDRSSPMAFWPQLDWALLTIPGVTPFMDSTTLEHYCQQHKSQEPFLTRLSSLWQWQLERGDPEEWRRLQRALCRPLSTPTASTANETIAITITDTTSKATTNITTTSINTANVKATTEKEQVANDGADDGEVKKDASQTEGTTRLRTILPPLLYELSLAVDAKGALSGSLAPRIVMAVYRHCSPSHAPKSTAATSSSPYQMAVYYFQEKMSKMDDSRIRDLHPGDLLVSLRLPKLLPKSKGKDIPEKYGLPVQLLTARKPDDPLFFWTLLTSPYADELSIHVLLPSNQ